ncbi:MAG: nucleotidyltransferase domain-containing protein [Polaribacter sp.]
MTYKEVLFFIGKCLTISNEEKNRLLIEKELKSEGIDWDYVVETSTAHYVFPALYCNLKRANFLHYLPEELVNYMLHITDLNRERNQQIIAQAKELNELLLTNNITPTFLKGTGNLLEGLYEDIGERMVGDIDFIFSKEEYPKAIEILTENGYSKVHKINYDYPHFRHYSRLQKENRIASIEIHKELIIEKYANEFNYNSIEKDILLLNGVYVMGYADQLSLSIIAEQINDKGLYFKNIALRNGYDVFLVSKKIDAKDTLKRFKKLFHPLNNFLACCYVVFGYIESLEYTKNSETRSYLSSFEKIIVNDKYREKKYRNTQRMLFVKKRWGIIYKSIFDKNHRDWLFNRITDKQWRNQKLIQLGLKKDKTKPLISKSSR